MAGGDAGQELAGRVALVTGSGRNIGRAIALGLAAGGADVVVNARANQAEAERVADEVRALGRRALAICADVRDEAAVRRMFAEARERFGPVTILVNNAAVFAVAEVLVNLEQRVAVPVFQAPSRLRELLPTWKDILACRSCRSLPASCESLNGCCTRASW